MIAKALLIGGFALSSLALFSSCGGGSSSNGRISTNVVNELQPGTTLHMIGVHYQRHGPAEEVLKMSESYQPETLRTESWTTFDKNGKLSDLRSESKTKDGKVFASSRLEDGQVISDTKGVEDDHRTDLSDLTLETVRARLQEAAESTKSAIAAHPNAPTVTIRGMRTLEIEQSRRPWAFQQGEISPGNYVSTYVYDLHPAEDVRREYVLPDGSYSLRSEWVAIDADGTETIIESWDHLVFEVLAQ